MCGNLAGLAADPFAAAMKASPNCCGMGLFPEAIEQNPVYYDLAFDLVWRDKKGVEIGPWFSRDYVRRRYGPRIGRRAEAWKILARTAYASGTIHSSALAARPRL